MNDNSQRRWEGLTTRLASALALAFVAFICLYAGGMLFAAFIMLCAIVMKKEWDGLISASDATMRAAGYFYIILPCASLLWIRGLPQGPANSFALVALISGTDIGAYFVGRKFGRHKLSPTISPNKTWEGLAGGIILAAVAALFLSPYVTLPHNRIFITGIAIAVLAQAGDLFESFMKRRAGVKDSGTLLPGHGGLLDRFDGYMFAAPVFAWLLHLASLQAAA